MAKTTYSPVHLEHADLMSQSIEARRIRRVRTPPKAQQTNTTRSRLRGRGMEFEEVRAYNRGDDVRSIDWRVTARTNQTHTKVFTEERERPVILVADFRSTMLFATRGAFKSVVSARSSALFAWMGLHNHERVGGLIITDNIRPVVVKPSRGKQASLHLFKSMERTHAHVLDAHLSQQAPVHPSEPLRQGLLELISLATSGSLIVINTDCIGLDDANKSLLARLARHCEVVLNIISDPIENEFPKLSRAHILHNQSIIKLNFSVRKVRQNYHNNFQQRLTDVQHFAHSNRIHVIHTSTAHSAADQIRLQCEVSRI